MKHYPLFKVHILKDKVVENIGKVFDSGFINEGVEVTKLTDELKRMLGAENLLLTNSGTSALTLALHLSGVTFGDEVISTPMTCVASNTPIVALGAKIVWADIDPNDGMIDPNDVLRKITPATKAVMAVAWAGTPPKLLQLVDICRSKGIKLILDAAHAFGAEYDKLPIHCWADFTCYSFQAIKHFTTGDGGALVCYDNQFFDRAKALKWFGLDRDKTKDDNGNWKGQQWDVDIVEAGYKFNMNNVSAAIGLSQISHIGMILSKHRKHAKLYDKLFSDFNLAKHANRTLNSLPSYWVYTMKLQDDCKISRDELLKKLNDEGIMAGVVHVPNNHYTVFKQFQTSLPGVDDFSSKQFSLPCGWWLSIEDVEHIASRVKELCHG